MNKILTSLAIIAIFSPVKLYHTKDQGKKIEIVRIDSTKEYYVFNTNSKLKEFSIVIGERKLVSDCVFKKKYILVDSIKESMNIKMGSYYTEIGFDALTIDKVKVKNAGILTKYIDNCESLSN